MFVNIYMNKIAMQLIWFFFLKSYNFFNTIKCIRLYIYWPYTQYPGRSDDDRDGASVDQWRRKTQNERAENSITKKAQREMVGYNCIYKLKNIKIGYSLTRLLI